ncbi:kinase-like domain-containing protein [Apiosordaria backusii]|uniref:EKC/KEOPS complex subunit BUD32 n=1 Tax=Apiosordaria backusii TaxID=314023 RepID=A0AA40BM57_9PEZI|nr:kinase-like domain-containing protein [Apiosordaria backusii]
MNSHSRPSSSAISTTGDNISPNINFVTPSALPQPLPTLVESPYLYRALGYHPIHPGDLLADNRFLVLNKLGHGRNSTVWLCLDHKARRRPYKAVRVFHVRASRLHHGDTVFFIWQKKDVLGISEKIAYEKLRLAVPIDQFHVYDREGQMNGGRGALVYPVLGPRVDDEGYLGYVAEKTGRSIWEVKKRVCYMVADALESMHGLGLCHADFRSENLLFEVKGLERLDVEEVKRVYGGQPKAYQHGLPLVVEEGDIKGIRPDYLIVKAGLNYRLLDEILAGKSVPRRRNTVDYDIYEDADECIPKVFLIDMGATWRFNELDPEPWYPLKEFYDKGIAPGGWCHRNFGQDRKETLPRAYTAPEVWLGWQNPSPESEVWALGCTIVKILLGKVPFGDQNESTEWDPKEKLTYERYDWEAASVQIEDDKGEMMKCWESFCGPLPKHYQARLKEDTPDRQDLIPSLDDDFGSGDSIEDGKVSERKVQGSGVQLGAGSCILEERTRKLGMPSRDGLQLLDLLKGIFFWDPKKRLNVTQILDHPWFQIQNRRG